jgi:DNA-binding XRE family transcriptional regulator
LKLTAKELSRELSVDQDTIYGREYHKTNLNPRRLKKIIDFLGQVPDIRFRQFCGERILAYRKLHGISYVKLAKIIGIHKTTLRQWAKTQRCPSKDFLEKLSSILDGILKENK